MKTGIFITARLGSTRLKRKHLLDVNGRPVMHYLIKRIHDGFAEEIRNGLISIFITTSEEQENKDFEIFCPEGAAVYYGSLSNIPLRHFQAAKENSIENIISVDGDDILCSVEGMRHVYSSLCGGKEYTATKGLPFGMNSSGYSTDFLERSLNGHRSNSLETGWGRIFDSGRLHQIELPSPGNNNLLRFTLDYPADLEFFGSVIDIFGERIYAATDEEIIRTVIEKQLFMINERIAREYWENFYNNISKEKVINNES